MRFALPFGANSLQPKRLQPDYVSSHLICPDSHSGEETPVLIPNTAVKLSSADGTDLETDRESRTLSGRFFRQWRWKGKKRALFMAPFFISVSTRSFSTCLLPPAALASGIFLLPGFRLPEPPL